eukprot:jgi/Pico_ML_1/53757/g4248.t1
MSTCPKILGIRLLEQKQIRMWIPDQVKAQKKGQHEHRHAIGRGGGMVDEEFVQLCDEVAERVEDAEAR